MKPNSKVNKFRTLIQEMIIIERKIQKMKEINDVNVTK